MAVNPISLTRISQTLRSEIASDSIRRNQRALFATQTRLATGRNFVAGSEDPVAATRVLDLTDALSRQRQFSGNLRHADNTLSAADQSISEAGGLIGQAHSIASQDVSNLTGAAERLADAEIIAGIRRQLTSLGNRQFNGRYLFSGRDTMQTPFLDVNGGVAFVGDTGELRTRVEDGLTNPINVAGNILMGALAFRRGEVDLGPRLTADVRIDDLQGATGRGIQTGVLLIRAGDKSFSVNLSGVDTMGDVVKRIQEGADQAGATLTAEIADAGLNLDSSGQELTITDNAGGATASSLGILTPKATNQPVQGADLGVRLSRLTAVGDLAGGATLDLESGIVIQNGSQSAVIDISTAKSVQDVINAMNSSGLYVRARINDARDGIEILNETSGAIMSIGENGGTTAADLGLRTLDESTQLATLNFGAGVRLDAGLPDLRIHAKDGKFVDVNLDGADTVGEAIEAINTAMSMDGVSVMASLAKTGNGVVLTDSSGGLGDLRAVSLNQSTAAVDLGLTGSASGMSTELAGADVGGVRTEGVLGALLDLEQALRRDDTRAISLSAERVDRFQEELVRVHGVVGARSQVMRSQLLQMQDYSQSTEIFLSEIRDLDYAQAATQLQGMQTQLQANLQTNSAILNLSLLDYLQ